MQVTPSPSHSLGDQVLCICAIPRQPECRPEQIGQQLDDDAFEPLSIGGRSVITCCGTLASTDRREALWSDPWVGHTGSHLEERRRRAVKSSHHRDLRLISPISGVLIHAASLSRTRRSTPPPWHLVIRASRW